MLSDDFLWFEVVERVESVSILNESSGEVVLKCVKVLMDYFEWKLLCEEKSLFFDGICNRFLKVKFLFLFQKLYKFFFFWKGDEI